MKFLRDAEGRPFDPVQRAFEEEMRALTEAMYGLGPDERVRLLRESILGGEAAPPPPLGLAAWLTP